MSDPIDKALQELAAFAEASWSNLAVVDTPLRWCIVRTYYRRIATWARARCGAGRCAAGWSGDQHSNQPNHRSLI